MKRSPKHRHWSDTGWVWIIFDIPALGLLFIAFEGWRFGAW